jgi:hypothetical protein
MKTSQRSFVVEFKSARRRGAAKPMSIWGDTDLKKLVREAEAAHTFKRDVLSETSGRDDDTLSQVEAVGKPAVRVLEGSGAALMPLPQQTFEPIPATQIRKAPPARERPTLTKVKPARSKKVAASPKQDQNAGDELEVLEAENLRLKRLLADELNSQNRQLREMLERFDDL